MSIRDVLACLPSDLGRTKAVTALAISAGEIGEVRSLRVVEAHAPMLLDAGALVIIKLPGGVEQSRFLRG